MVTFVFDTETTGLVQNSAQNLSMQPHIIELYGCLIEDDGTVLDQLEFLCHPGIEISAEITKITGIKNEDVKGEKAFKEYYNQLQSFVSRANAVCAHNLKFDLTMVEIEAQRLQQKFIWPENKICTVEATEYVKGRRLHLFELHELLFGENFEGAHRAKNDVQALVRCFVELRKKGDL